MSEEIMMDVVSFTDDEGNEFEMVIVEEFEHKGKKYAVLSEMCDCEHEEGEEGHEGCQCGCGEGDEECLYIFEVVSGEEGEEFVAIDDDDLLDELGAVVEELLENEDEE